MIWTPERQAILEAVRRVRDGVDPHRNPNFAQHVTRIPIPDYKAIIRLYPLDAIDPEEKSAAWEAFLKSPFSEPYRVNKVVRGITKNGMLVK